MLSTRRPYLIVPKLIEQPTWGGDYIVKYKNWLDKSDLKNIKIGQSYELFDQSNLLINIYDSSDIRIKPEIIYLSTTYTKNQNKDNTLEKINLSDLVMSNPKQILGKKILEKFLKMPILIKFTQALGNSFQTHIKPNVFHHCWRPKAESWYYFEDGLLSFGIKKGINLQVYQKTCQAIDTRMRQLSSKILSGDMALSDAQDEAKKFIHQLNPWQFVNIHKVDKNILIDLSMGGLHHSWEDDLKNYPKGNILYEIQQDMPDSVSTIRCFDQGKFKEDGNIRELHIADYFKFIDLDIEHNKMEKAICQRSDNNLLSTKYYTLDILEISDRIKDNTGNSFCHLFVREGEININTDGGNVHLSKGHSCFLPKNVGEYEIKSTDPKQSVILKTYIKI